MRLRIAGRLPRVFEKDAAQGEESLEVGNIPAHARFLDAGGGQLFARTLNRSRADEVPPLAISPVGHTGDILLKVVQNRGEGGADVENRNRVRNQGLH